MPERWQTSSGQAEGVVEPLSELERLCAMLEDRFELDAMGRIPTRLTSGAPTPRFVFARTPLGNAWRFREDLDGTSVRDLARLAAREPAITREVWGHAPPERLEPLRRVLECTGDSIAPTRVLLLLLRDGDSEQVACYDVGDRAGWEEAVRRGCTPLGDLFVFS